MSLSVCKFGGSSLADGNNISRVTEIIGSDPARRFVVVSAPGKRYSDDIKVTDLLYACYRESVEKGSCAETFQKIRKRFRSIVTELGMDSFDIDGILDETERAIEENKSADFTASRGEYLNARVVAAKLGRTFIDAKDIIFFDDKKNSPLRGVPLSRDFTVREQTEKSELFPAAAATSAALSWRAR